MQLPISLSELAAQAGLPPHWRWRAIPITGVAGMEQADSSQLTFLANPKYAHKVKDTRAGAILVAEPIPALPIPQLISTNPYLDFARALALFYQPPRPKLGIHPSASVADSARIGEDASIGAFAVVGENVVIGTKRGSASPCGDL